MRELLSRAVQHPQEPSKESGVLFFVCLCVFLVFSLVSRTRTRDELEWSGETQFLLNQR